MIDERCGHVLCGRTAYERDLADSDCTLEDCPFKWRQETVEARSPLARAIEEARGGPAPVEFKGYA